MSQCRICLENYSGTYYAGSEIKGRIECYFDDETTVRGIKIEIKCKEHNEWMGTEEYRDPHDNTTKTRHITLTGDRDVFHVKQMLFGSESGSRELPRGRHVYPFSYHLPYDIPSSYHGPHGSITFKLKAVVDRPMRTDYEDKFIFQVISPIDFNRLSKDLQETTSYSDEKTVCCWCCQGGNVSVEVELPKIAFVPGETIPFNINVTNMSNTNVDNLKIKLTKTVTYKVTDPDTETKEDVETILSFGDHGVGAHGQHTFNLQLAIPPSLEVPNFNKCHLFKVEYALKVSAEMGGCTMDLDVDAWDIQMGHIQYGGTANHPSQTNQYQYQPPPVSPYPPPSGGTYPPPAGGASPGFYPSPGGAYPPPTGPGGAYPPPTGPGGSYPPSAGPGVYPPPAGPGVYPPPAGPGGYPPPAGPGGYPPPSGPGGYPPPSGPGGYQFSPGFTANTTEKSSPSPGPPTAPVDENPKAREAAMGGPGGPSAPSNAPEAPPPSYNELQQNSNFTYPPK